MIQLNKNKKAQEEMVGFVLIMLVVGIIFLVFLGIYFRGASQTDNTQSKDIANFIEAVSKYTTRCGDSDEYPYSLITLVTECYKDPTSNCPNNGENKCDILKETLSASIEENWQFHPDSPTKSYRFQVLRETQGPEVPVIPSFGSGNPTDRIRSAEKPLPQGVILSLEIYY